MRPMSSFGGWCLPRYFAVLLVAATWPMALAQSTNSAQPTVSPLSIASEVSKIPVSDDSSSKTASSSNPKSDDGAQKAWSSAYDPSKLEVQNKNDVRIRLISEDPAFRNTLGYNLGSDKGRTAVQTLATSSIGTTIDLGKFGTGTPLNFFLLASTADGTKKALALDGSASTDSLRAAGLSALSATLSNDGKSPYLFLTINERLANGTKPTPKAVVEIDLGSGSLLGFGLISTPEPPLYWMLPLFGIWGGWRWRQCRSAGIA